MTNESAVLVCGDITWGLTGNPSTSVVGLAVVGAAVRSAAKKRVALFSSSKPNLALSLKEVSKRLATQAKKTTTTKPKAAAVKLATKAVLSVAKQRKDLANKRLAGKSPVAQKKAKETATALLRLPKTTAKRVVKRLAETVAVRQASPKVTRLPNGSEVLEPSSNSQLAEQLQDVSDAVWSSRSDTEYDSPDTEYDSPDTEYDSPETDYDDELDDSEPEDELDDDEFDGEFDADDEEEQETMDNSELGWDVFGAVKSVGKSVVKGVKKVNSVVKAVTSSKLVKATAMGAAFVCPAVGVPAVAAIGIAAKVSSAVESKDPKKRAAAVKMVRTTHELAKAGDKDAARGLAMIAVTSSALKAKRTGQLPDWKKRVISAIQAA